MTGFASIALCGLTAAGADKALIDKTLVVWASPDRLEQGGGSALMIDGLKGGFGGNRKPLRPAARIRPAWFFLLGAAKPRSKV